MNVVVLGGNKLFANSNIVVWFRFCVLLQLSFASVNKGWMLLATIPKGCVCVCICVLVCVYYEEFEFDPWCETCNLFLLYRNKSFAVFLSVLLLLIMRITIDESQCGITGVSRLLLFCDRHCYLKLYSCLHFAFTTMSEAQRCSIGIWLAVVDEECFMSFSLRSVVKLVRNTTLTIAVRRKIEDPIP